MIAQRTTPTRHAQRRPPLCAPLCDCGLPATRHVVVMQLLATGKAFEATLPLCVECYAMMVEEDCGILRTY